MSLESVHEAYARLADGRAQGQAEKKAAVLVVDDEPQLITAVADALEDKYRVLGETSPQSALEILKADAGIHVIISDQRMPVMAGSEFLFRAQEFSSATRLLVTAYADLESVISAVNRGRIFGYIRKPWNEGELRHVVDTAANHFMRDAILQQEKALLECIVNCNKDLFRLGDSRNRSTTFPRP
jgi:two-component system cell cycle sensor histidine kinase PleC